MKKFIKSTMAMALAIISATAFVSCNNDDSNSNSNPTKDPNANVIMGKYELYFPIMTVTYWPDNAAGIEEKYEDFKKPIINGLKSLNIEDGKTLKLSDMEANKTQAEKMYNSFGTFKYSVKACRNFPTSLGLSNMFLRVYVGSGNSDKGFYIGEKKMECTLDVPADATCQPWFEFTSLEGKYPETKEYNTEVMAKVKDALKEVFKDDYSTVPNNYGVRFYNYVNLTGDIENYKASIKAAMTNAKKQCPAVPQKAIDAVPAANKIFSCQVFIFNPKAEDNAKSASVCHYTLEAKGDGTIKLTETIGKNTPVEIKD